jgi:hypothetical protein
MAPIAWQTGELLAVVGDGGQAERSFCEITGRSPTTLRKYRRAARAIGRYFAVPGGELPTFLSNVSLQALAMLDNDVGMSAIDAVTQKATQGPVTERDIKALLEENTRALQASLDESRDKLADALAEQQNLQAQLAESERAEQQARARADSADSELRAA